MKKVREREPGMSLGRAKLVALIEHLDHGVGQVLHGQTKRGTSGGSFPGKRAAAGLAGAQDAGEFIHHNDDMKAIISKTD